MYIDPYKLADIEVEGYGKFEAEQLNGAFSVLQKMEDDVYLVRFQDFQYTLRILNEDHQAGTFLLRINGSDFSCNANTRLSHLIKDLGYNKKPKVVTGQIIAPMPGLVLSVKIKKGDHANEGQNLLILEAMKMENIIKATQCGIIAHVHVKQGDKVDKGQLLIEFE